MVDVKLLVAVVSIVYLVAIVAAVSYFAFVGPSRNLTGSAEDGDGTDASTAG